MTANQGKATRSTARRGVALLLVMGAVAVVFVIGMSILSGLPGTAQASRNLMNRDAAVYLAESGIVEAIDRLIHPPDASPIWAGVTGRQIPGMNGTYDVAIQDMGDGYVEVLATGHAPGLDGHTVSHQVLMIARVLTSTPFASYNMTHTAVVGTGGYIPGSARMRGDIFVNGFVTNFGRVDGTLAASSAIFNFGQVQAIASHSEAIEMPTVNVDAYDHYIYNGNVYQATVFTAEQAVAYAGNGAAMSHDNPLGVTIVDGDLSLAHDVTVENGILVVKGNLKLNGHELRINGPADHAYIILIVEGDTDFNNSGSTLRTTEGVAYFGGIIKSGLLAYPSKLRAEGGAIARQGFPLTFNGEIDVDFIQHEGDGVDLKFFGDGASNSVGTSQRAVVPIRYHANPSS